LSRTGLPLPSSLSSFRETFFFSGRRKESPSRALILLFMTSSLCSPAPLPSPSFSIQLLYFPLLPNSSHFRFPIFPFHPHLLLFCSLPSFPPLTPLLPPSTRRPTPPVPLSIFSSSLTYPLLIVTHVSPPPTQLLQLHGVAKKRGVRASPSNCTSFTLFSPPPPPS